MRSRAVILFLVLFALFIFVKEIPAQRVYEFTDEKGVRHFTDAPTDKRYFREKVYTLPAVPRMSMDFKDADVRFVISAMSDAWGVNILIADDVRGRVTIRRISTPVDRLLDEVLSMCNLVKFREENFIIVCRAENAEMVKRVINIQKQKIQILTERNRLATEIKALSDDVMANPRKYPTPDMRAVNEAMEIINSFEITGDQSDYEFLGTMKALVGAIKSKKAGTRDLEFLADRARALRGHSGPMRSGTTHIWPSPPPVVNVWK